MILSQNGGEIHKKAKSHVGVIIQVNKSILSQFKLNKKREPIN